MISFRKRVKESFTLNEINDVDKELRDSEFTRIQSIIRSVKTEEQLEPLLILIDKFRNKHLDNSLCDILLKEFKDKRVCLDKDFQHLENNNWFNCELKLSPEN